MQNTNSKNTNSNLYKVIYRTGGTVNFIWRETFAVNYAKALTTLKEVETMGYTAYVEYSEATLPNTYHP